MKKTGVSLRIVCDNLKTGVITHSREVFEAHECITLRPLHFCMNLAVDYTYSAKYNAKVHRLTNAAKFRIADATLVNVHYEKCGLAQPTCRRHTCRCDYGQNRTYCCTGVLR